MQNSAAPSVAWLDTLRELLHYYVPPIPSSAAAWGVCIAAVIVGVVVTFRSAKVARTLVLLVGAAAGAAIGNELAQALGGPGPVSAAVGGVLVGALAWRTYRFWLAIGSVAAIVFSATAYQVVSSSDLTQLLPQPGKSRVSGQTGGIRLASPSEQAANLYGDPAKEAQRLWEHLSTTMRSWGLKSWLWPVLALVAGVVLALWALQVVAVMWIGLIGALLAAAGTVGLISIQFPEYQASLIQHPQYVLGAAGLLWVFGLVWQARLARLVTKPASAPKPSGG